MKTLTMKKQFKKRILTIALTLIAGWITNCYGQESNPGVTYDDPFTFGEAFLETEKEYNKCKANGGNCRYRRYETSWSGHCPIYMVRYISTHQLANGDKLTLIEYLSHTSGFNNGKKVCIRTWRVFEFREPCNK